MTTITITLTTTTIIMTMTTSNIVSNMWVDPFKGCSCLHMFSLLIAYHVLTITLPTTTCAELTAICEGRQLMLCWDDSHVGFPYPAKEKGLDYTGFIYRIPIPKFIPDFGNLVLIVSLRMATCAELTAKCEGSRFVLLLFAYHSITNCLPCLYYFCIHCYMPRIDSKVWGDGVGVAADCIHFL